MGRYRVISAYLLAGGKVVEKGSVVELDPHAGRVKVQQGFVVALTEEPTVVVPSDEVAAEEEMPADDELQARHGDPTPRRRRTAG